MSDIRIYTDGSANNKTHDKGGYGFVIINGTVRQFCGGSYTHTNSARMEMTAIIKALRKCETSDQMITVFCDCQHIVHSLEKGWIFRWKQRDFAGRKNVDLWKQFLKEYSRLEGRVRLKWLKGHNDTHWNEVADILANRGANKKLKIKDLL